MVTARSCIASRSALWVRGGEDGARREGELLRLLRVDVGAQQIDGHQIGRELDAAELAAQEPRER
jgi:hypothetical protein